MKPIALQDRRVGDLDDVARILGKSKDWLFRNRAALEAGHGFPRVLPGMGCAYDLVAIHDWLDRWRRPPTPALEIAGDDPAELEQLLTRRAARLAETFPREKKMQ